MNLIRSLLGRRQFLAAILTSIVMLAFGRVTRALDLISQMSSAKTSAKEGSASKRSLKGLVIYYSGTGSTAKVAGAIYHGMKSVMESDVAPIEKIDPKEMGKYDVIAIGGPIWFYREPANLRLFIYNMPQMTGKACILFCTHGTTPHGFFNSLAQPLQKKAFTIIGWNDWYGDTLQYKQAVQPYITHGHPDEIDLREAEEFGKEMALRARRIFAGEKNLIPEIPIDSEENLLWRRSGVMGGGNGRMPGRDAGAGGPSPASGGGMTVSQAVPKIDTSKCVYPRCRACMDNCIVNAIDLSMKSPAAWVSDSSILIKSCVRCGFPLCQRSCCYDAIIYKGDRTEYSFDMTKCTYPECTLCVDHCPMKSIDFSQDQPVRHNNCEGCDLCWSICPAGAIEIINQVDRMNAEQLIERLKKEIQESPQYKHYRQLLPDGEWGKDGKMWYSKKLPRVVLDEKDWPFHVNE